MVRGKKDERSDNVKLEQSSRQGRHRKEPETIDLLSDSDDDEVVVAAKAETGRESPPRMIASLETDPPRNDEDKKPRAASTRLSEEKEQDNDNEEEEQQKEEREPEQDKEEVKEEPEENGEASVQEEEDEAYEPGEQDISQADEDFREGEVERERTGKNEEYIENDNKLRSRSKRKRSEDYQSQVSDNESHTQGSTTQGSTTQGSQELGIKAEEECEENLTKKERKRLRKERKREKKKRKKEKKEKKRAADTNSRLVEVSVPTDTEQLLHYRMKVPLAAFAKNSSDISNLNMPLDVLATPSEDSELSFAVDWPSQIRKRRRRRVRAFRDRQSLKVRYSRTRGYPVLRLYDQLEPADETAEQYGYIQRFQPSSGFQHVLFSGSNPLFCHSSTASDLMWDHRPHLKEWYPYDPNEYILNEKEQELVWLFEESLHCFGGQKADSIEWDFVWEYASPSLKVELRSFGDMDNQAKYNALVRWKDPLVVRRMKVNRQYVADLLNQGIRRPHMKKVLAVLRLQKPCDAHGQRLYPAPDFVAGNSESYPYNKQHEGAKKRKESKYSVEIEDDYEGEDE